MAIRYILIIAIFQLTIISCHAVNGIIWCKQKQEFVPLFSIPQFSVLREKNLASRRATRMHGFNNETVVKAVYYEEKNMVVFYDNDTKVTGIYGEIWYLLADYLNFTFVPIKSADRNFGEKMENGSHTGLVGMLMREEAQVILRSEFFSARMNIVDYTIPLWKSKFHIYVRPTWVYDNSWVFTLFSPMTWYSVVFLFIILSFVGYLLQKVLANYIFKRRKANSMDFSLGDHIFYSYAIMCAQGYIPETFHKKFKILSLSKNLFALLILLVFSSHLMYRMMNRNTMLPFKDIETLLNNTKYILLTLRGSFLYNSLHYKYGNNEINSSTFARIYFETSSTEMHRKICDDVEKYAMFEIEDQFKSLNRYNCPLQATGNFNETWITFAIRKNFHYKKAIDIALIKFNEVGLMDVLRDRWLSFRLENNEKIMFKTIDLYQVYSIFIILCYGALISFAILIIENIIYYFGTKSSQNR